MAKVTLKLRATTYQKDGKTCIRFNSNRYYEHQVQKLRDKKQILVTIESIGAKRSLNQNAYWHGVCYPVLAELTGHTEMEMKSITKKMFLKPRILSIKGTEYEIPRETSELEKWDGVEYTESMILLASDLGGLIPTPAQAGYATDGNTTYQ